MSGRSYNSHMRPQDRDGSNHGAVGRGCPHQAYSRGHSRSSDFHDMRSRHRYDERDMNNSERRSDPYHAFRSSDRPYASSHRRSYVPSLSQYASSSHSHSYQRNSSYSHEGSRSPDHHHNVQSNHNNNRYDQSRRPRNFGGRQPKDASYEHHPLASTNGAEMHRARSLMMRSNDFQRYNNAENYANISCDGRMSNMNSYHSHYHQPQPRYDHPKSTSQTYCVGHMSNMNSYHSHYHQPQSRYDHPKSTSQTYCVGHMSNMNSYHSHYHQPQPRYDHPKSTSQTYCVGHMSNMTSYHSHYHQPQSRYDHPKSTSQTYCVGHMSNMNSYHSHYHQPQSRYDHPKSTSQTYHERPPHASRQDFSSNLRSSQQISWPTAPRFSNDHTFPELIRIAYSNLAAMRPSATAAFWNKVLKQMNGRNAPNPLLPNHREGLDRHLDQIFEHTQETLMLFSMKDLAQTIYSMAKIAEVLRKRGRRCGEDIDASLCGLLLNHDMTLNEDLFQSFASASRDKLHQFDARHLSNLAYAYASIGYVPQFDDESDLFDHIATQAVERSAEFNAQDISNMLWAFATVDKPHALLFEAMGDQVVAFKHLGEFKPQELANTVRAYAKVGIHRLMLFEKMANHIVGLDSLDRFTHPQDVSNTVWAFATAGIRHPKLFDKVANHIIGLDSLERFKPQQLTNTLWAYAKAGLSHPMLFEKVANHNVRLDILYGFNPQDLSITLWAYATADISHPILFEKVAIHIVGLDSLDRFDPQALSNTVWAYATAGIHHPNLFEKMANHITGLDSLDQFKPQDLTNTLWAYATAQVSHPKLFRKVSSTAIQRKEEKLFQKVTFAAIQRREEFNSQDVANLLWAYATMGIVEKQLFLSFVPTAAKLIDSYTNQELANIAWAYAVANLDAPTLFNDVFINVCVEKKDGFENEALTQLHQWHLWQTKEKSHAGLPLELQKKCYEAFTSEDPRASKLQDDVVSQLSSISLELQEEVLMDSGYRIDALVEVNGNTVGVEVDGPSHFIGRSEYPTGSTILKRRQVPSIGGIELVSVPYWEWDKLGKDEVKKQEYLRELLKL